MLLRIVAIILLVMLAVRLLMAVAARLLAALETGRRPPSSSGPARERRVVKQLAQCPVCGAHFEADRGLPRRSGEPPVCSESCRAAAAAGDDRGPAASGATGSGTDHRARGA